MKHEDVPPAVDLIFSGRTSPHLEVCSQSSHISGYTRICIFFVTSIIVARRDDIRFMLFLVGNFYIFITRDGILWQAC